MLMRGAGYVCRSEVLNKAGRIQWLVLVDQSQDKPHAGMAPTWKQAE